MFQTKSLNLLKNVCLQWPTLKIPEKSTDDYYLPQGKIRLIIPPESKNFLLYNMKISPGDLVCIRYDVKDEQCKAVYHLVVKEMYEGMQTKIEMEYIGRRSCQISPKMAVILKQRQPIPVSYKWLIYECLTGNKDESTVFKLM